jgi:hypothetical protein
VFGEGIASYMNDGGTDLAPGGTVTNPDAETVPLLGIVAYLDHKWNDKWTSSIGYSRTDVDNTSLQDPDAFKLGEYASVNALYQGNERFLAGVELLWGRREDNNGANGEDVRLQFSIRYNFSVGKAH